MAEGGEATTNSPPPQPLQENTNTPSQPEGPTGSKNPDAMSNNGTRRLKILFVGATGAGKSSFIYSLRPQGSGESMVGNDGDPCTQDCKSYLKKYRGVEFELVDTPGFNDPTRRVIDILENISPHVNGVAGVVYCHPLTDTRLTGEGKLNLNLIKAMCGPHFFSRMVICSTFWDASNDRQTDRNQERMEGLLHNHDQFGSIMEGGAVYMKFWGSTDPSSSERVLDHFLRQRRPPALAILRQQHHSYQQSPHESYQFHTKKTDAGRVADLQDEQRRSQRPDPREKGTSKSNDSGRGGNWFQGFSSKHASRR